MAHPKDDQLYPIGTIVRLKKTGEMAEIKDYTFLMNRKGFLNYLGQIEGKGSAVYALYHDDIELECLPKTTT